MPRIAVIAATAIGALSLALTSTATAAPAGAQTTASATQAVPTLGETPLQAADGTPAGRSLRVGGRYLNIHQCSYVAGSTGIFTSLMPNAAKPAFTTGTGITNTPDTQLSCGPGGNGWQPDSSNSAFKSYNLTGGKFLNLHQCVYRTSAGETFTSVLPNSGNPVAKAGTNVSDTADTQLFCGPGGGGWTLDTANSQLKSFDLTTGRYLNLHQCVYNTSSGQTYTNILPNTPNTNFNTGSNVSNTADTQPPSCGSGGNGWTQNTGNSTVQALTSTGNWPMCLDVGGTRNNNDNVRIWQCVSTNNQNLVVENGYIKVADTIGTAQPMCLDVGGSRNNRDNVKIFQCPAAGQSNTNQVFVIQNGLIKVADTIGTAQPMCLDVGTTRNNNDNVMIYQCPTAGQSNTNQWLTVQDGKIKVQDTL